MMGPRNGKSAWAEGINSNSSVLSANPELTRAKAGVFTPGKR